MINHKKKGFTLIEIIIVIVIIGILAAVLIPKILGAEARARDVQHIKDVRDLADSMFLYKVDNNHFPTFKDVIIQQSPGFNFLTQNDATVTFKTNFSLVYHANPSYNYDNYCYYYNTLNQEAANNEGDCSSSLVIEGLLTPKYIKKIPRSSRTFVLGTMEFGYSQYNWTISPYRDNAGVEHHPTDYYNILVLPNSLGGNADDSIVVSAPVETVTNANRLALSKDYSYANKSHVYDEPAWDNRPLADVIRPSGIFSFTQSNRSISEIQKRMCSKIIETDMSVGADAGAPLNGLNNPGGICYLPIKASVYTVCGSCIGTTNHEQYLRYLYSVQ